MFYTVILTTTQAVFAYDTIDAATEKFHTELAYAINQQFDCTCVIMDKHGAIYKTEEYHVPAAPAEE